MTPIRFGLIACSSVARRRFVPALLKSTGARLEQVGSRSPEKARAFAAEFGCAHSGTYEDVLHDPRIDAVYISTTTSEHEYWSLEAARHGKHVLCEKPSAMNLAGAKKTVAECRQHDVAFLEGYMFRFHPQHAVVLQQIQAGAIGAPAYVTAQFTYPRPPAGDFRHSRDLGGGVFFDAAGYTSAAAAMLIPAQPASIYAALKYDTATGVDCAAALAIQFGSGAGAHCFAGFGLQYTSRYSVLGSGGRIELTRAFAVPPDAETTVAVEQGQNREVLRVPPADQFRLMIEKFAEACRNRDLRRTFEEQFLYQSAIMDTALQSATTGKPVIFNPNYHGATAIA